MSHERITTVKRTISLLVTAPQLWDAANEFIKQAETDGVDVSIAYAAFTRLKNMVAKAVGKDDWSKVLQSKQGGE